MAMTREEQDAFDRKMAGINTPGAYGEGMAALDRAVGNPIASYSLDDLRRMFLRGSAAPVATPGAMPAETEAMSPSLPTDALRGPALPGPVTAAPLPPPAPPAAMPTGTRPAAPVMPPPPAPPAARMGAGMPFESQLDQRMLSVSTPAEMAKARAKAQQLAAVLARTVPTGVEAASPGFEMQVMPDRLGGMPPEAQADQTMRSVSVVNPQSFGQRFRRTMRGE